MGILRLQERRRVRLFVHREPYGRFVSCLVFIPRDRYTTEVRANIAQLLVAAYGSKSYEWNTRLSDSVLARLHYVLHLDAPGGATVDIAELELSVAAAARAWIDDLRDALIAARGEETGLDALRVWVDAFPGAYQYDFDATEALTDLSLLERLGEGTPLAARLTIGAEHLDLKLYGIGAQPSLSEVLPRLSNMGVVVDDEHPYELSPKGLDKRWMKWFRLRAPAGTIIDPAALRLFEEAFLAVVDRRAEDDGFNRLVLTAGLAWREVALLRAYCRYLRQTGTRFSLSYIEDALSAHTEIARRLVELFVARLDPWIAGLNGAGSEGDGDATEQLASCAPCCISCSRRCGPTGSRTPTARAIPCRVSRSSSTRARSPISPSRARCSRSSCTRRASRVCTCARARSRAAASAGRTGGRISGPRSSGS
jgi:glutamate dehydrogenase